MSNQNALQEADSSRVAEELRSDWGCTDTGNKDRFVRDWKDRLIYIVETKQWVFWDGDRWTASFDLYTKAEETVKSIFVEASQCKDPAGRERLGKWAITSNRTGVIDSMLRRASGALARSIKEFDTDPYLINCRNGVLDLKRMTFRARRADDLLLQVTNVDYNHGAVCPKWLAFLRDIHEDNEELIGYLQLLYGYAMTGLVKDQHFVIFHGDGRNGKGIETNTIRKILGDYATTLPFSVFLEKRDGNVRVKESIGSLKGKRFTLASEGKRGSVFDAAHIKEHTGGDQREGAVLHQSAFKYDPTDKLFLVTNYLPTVQDTTIAFWDRVIVVPFNKQYLGDDRDTSLEDGLISEWEGIFAWMVAGAFRYLQGEKLHRKPDVVIEATKEYELQNDSLKKFISDRLERDPKERIPVGETHTVYLEWFDGQDQPDGEACPLRYFRERMGKRGVRSKAVDNSQFFLGYHIKGSQTKPVNEEAEQEPRRFKPAPWVHDLGYKEVLALTPEQADAYFDGHAQELRERQKMR